MGSFTQTLGITFPIVLAPMAGTVTPELAAEVSNAGGLGSLGLAGKSVTDARAMIRRYKELSSGPLNVNFFCHQEPKRDATVESQWIDHLRPLFAEAHATAPAELAPSYTSFLGDEAMLEMVLEEAPAVVSFHFGLPDAEVINRLHSNGTFLIATATNVAEAEQIISAGLDGVIAQGAEAGGHRGVFQTEVFDEQLSTAALVSLIRPRTHLPVIAAGGIMNRSGIEAMTALGADAVQLGTAFILCPESAAKDAYRAALQAGGKATKLSRVYSGRPARGLVEPFMEFAENTDRRVPAFPVAYSANKQLAPAAAEKGIPGMSPHWAGQGYPLAVAEPAAAVMKRLTAATPDAPALRR